MKPAFITYFSRIICSQILLLYSSINDYWFLILSSQLSTNLCMLLSSCLYLASQYLSCWFQQARQSLSCWSSSNLFFCCCKLKLQVDYCRCCLSFRDWIYVAQSFFILQSQCSSLVFSYTSQLAQMAWISYLLILSIIYESSSFLFFYLHRSQPALWPLMRQASSHDCIYYQNYILQLPTVLKVIIQVQYNRMIKGFKRISLLLLLASLSGSFSVLPAAITQISLNDKWNVVLTKVPQSKKQLQDVQLTTTLPSTIHLDLLKHNKIEDPFHRDNYPKLKWVSQCNARYSKHFEVDQTNLKRAAELVFHGIDTYATVKLNGQPIIKANNAFVRYSARVEKYLQKNNLLEVDIMSSQQYDTKAQQLNPMPFRYAHTRKACYQYSWDWAPELITIGMWKDVQLRFYDQIRIDYVWVRNRLISEEKAIINFATKFQLNLFRDDKLSQGYLLIIKHEGKKLNQIQVVQQTAYVDIHIQNPQLWWPHGIGEPFIYDFEVTLKKGDTVIDSRKIPFGIRTIELNLQNKQFQIKVNGNPVYCKGANYVPLDMFHPRIYNKDFQTNKTYTIQKLFDDIVESNFNMIRVWGGGQYESDYFMELASRKGIMVFYDFMFSDSIYPSNAQFLEIVEEEVKQQVRRARNYPALTIWCGNNQIYQGIKDWGWSSDKYIKDYERLFQKLIRKVVNIENPDIPYIPSSPIYAVGNYGFDRGGDFHYWSVWAGGAAFDSYETAVGPFNSQFGTQALPVWHTIKDFTQEEDRKYQSAVLLTHERHNSQFGTLRNYIKMYTNKSKNFQNQVYLSGVVQAYGIEIAIKAQRAAKSKSYGTLYWQLNDAWPAISWSSIDYYGRWKALQYMAKRAFTNIAIFAFKNGSVLAINDNLYPVDVVAKVVLMQFDGNVLSTEQKSMTLGADAVKQVLSLSVKSKYKEKTKQIVMYTQIMYKDVRQMSSTNYYEQIKDLQLPKAPIKVKYNTQKNELTVSSEKLIKNLFIDHKQHYVHFSDNYFDVVPGYPVTISVAKGTQLSSIKSQLTYTSIRQASQEENLQVILN